MTARDIGRGERTAWPNLMPLHPRNVAANRIPFTLSGQADHGRRRGRLGRSVVDRA